MKKKKPETIKNTENLKKKKYVACNISILYFYKGILQIFLPQNISRILYNYNTSNNKKNFSVKQCIFQ